MSGYYLLADRLFAALEPWHGGDDAIMLPGRRAAVLLPRVPRSPSELMARVACFSNTVSLWSLLAELSWPGVVEIFASPWAANTEWYSSAI